MSGAFDPAENRVAAAVAAGASPCPDTPSAAPQVPLRLGEYELVEKLAEGGAGAVYRATHTILGRQVALKVLGRGHLEDPQAVARFEREMRVLGGIDDPHIVRALDARQVDGVRFLVMEFLLGLDVQTVLHRCAAMTVADACEIVRQAAQGLQCAADHGLVHRDIKPSNLMLVRNGIVKILDLGLARLAMPQDQELTAINQILGTLDYMAPEQISDSRSVDIRADLYSLGCTLYKLLCGRPPFGEPEYQRPIERVYAHLHAEPVPVEQRRTDVPKPLAAFVARLLAKRPDDRPATPRQVVEAVRPFAWGADLVELLAGAEGRLPPEPAELPGLSTNHHQPHAHTLLRVQEELDKTQDR